MRLWPAPARKPAAPQQQGVAALVIADTRPDFGDRSLAEFVADHDIAAVITAGDLHRSDIAGVDGVDVPVMGVYGNHCDRRYLEELGMANLHLTTAVVGSVRVTGLQGCVRYKPGTKDLLYTQDEYAELISELPPAEVLVTHCPPAGINDDPADPAHVGIIALRGWLERHRPKMVIHGHTYPTVPTSVCGRTRIEYVHGARVLHLPYGGGTP